MEGWLSKYARCATVHAQVHVCADQVIAGLAHLRYPPSLSCNELPRCHSLTAKLRRRSTKSPGVSDFLTGLVNIRAQRCDCHSVIAVPARTCFQRFLYATRLLTRQFLFSRGFYCNCRSKTTPPPGAGQWCTPLPEGLVSLLRVDWMSKLFDIEINSEFSIVDLTWSVSMIIKLEIGKRWHWL